MITKKPTRDPFDDLFAVISNKIHGFNLSFFNFIKINLKNNLVKFLKVLVFIKFYIKLLKYG